MHHDPLSRPHSFRPPRAPFVALMLAASVTAQARFDHPDGTPHRYAAITVPGGCTWTEASRGAAALGGYLATITSAAEATFVGQVAAAPNLWVQDASSGAWNGPWIGGAQIPGSQEPSGGFGWAEIEGFTLQDWTRGQPDNDLNADRIHLGGSTSGPVGTWGDRSDAQRLPGYVVEFSGPFVRRTVGLVAAGDSTLDGYTLFNPLRSVDSWLVDGRGGLVHRFRSAYTPGTAIYLRPNGNLLRSGRLGNTHFLVGGAGGIVEEIDWQDNVVWSFTLSDDRYLLHHDVEELPNGNLLMIAWEKIDAAQAIAAGRDPALLPEGEVWPDKIIEVDAGGTIVWEWRAFDHLIQDFDPTKGNHGPIGQHPGRIDFNYVINAGEADWMHTNGIAYHAGLDQIMLSVRSFDELWVIDHSTTTAEAAGSTGGRSGRGGDLLYRWGNPRAYGSGTAADQRLFKQHDAHWIPPGLPGAGNILVFNNGTDRPGGHASSVDEIVPPPVDPNGNYARSGGAFGPSGPTWSFTSSPPTAFYSQFVSGAQRLPSGNTLICAGWIGTLFEVTPANDVVWLYRVPLVLGAPAQQGGETSENFVFRSPHYGPNHPGLATHNLDPSGPIERYRSILLAEGAAADLHVSPGTNVDFELRAPDDAGALYVVGTSVTQGLTPIDLRFVRLGVDFMLEASLGGSATAVFRSYAGMLDSAGNAHAVLAIPPIPGLAGLDLPTMFVVGDASAPSGIGLISNTVLVRIR